MGRGEIFILRSQYFLTPSPSICLYFPQCESLWVPLNSCSHYSPHPLLACHSRLKITPFKDIPLSGCTFEPFSNLV